MTPKIGVLNISDRASAGIYSDEPGQACLALLRAWLATPFETDYKIIPDEPATLEPLLLHCLADPSIDCILTNGGTGISRRDLTIDILAKHIDLPLPGFGELFRMLSYAEIGSAAILSRAVGGLMGRLVVLVMPGSRAAVELAMSKIILPELRHLVGEARKIV